MPKPFQHARLCGFILLTGSICSPLLAQSGPQLSAPTGQVTDEAPSANTVPSEFGAVGRLQRVRRNDTGSLRYAILDRANKILAFIAPTTRFQLQELIGEEVAVTGRTLSHQDDIAPYVMLEEISSMSGEPVVTKEQTTTASTQPTGRALRQASFEFETLPPAQLTSHDVASRGSRTTAANEPAQFDDSDYLVPIEAEPHFPCDECGPTCTSSCTSCGGCQPCGCLPYQCGPPGWLWLRGEYLAWWTDGMDTPPLVTTSPAGTPINEAGVLGAPGTEILYGGDDDILRDARSGFRVRFGGFLGCQRCFGWEGEYFGLNDHELFSASCAGDGTPIISRPFFNINPREGADGSGPPDPPAREDAELVCYPDVLRGQIDVLTDSDFQGAAGRLRYNICCKQRCVGCCGVGCTGCGGCGHGCYPNACCGYPPWMRIDFTAGYRFLSLDEALLITEDLTSLQAANPGRFEIFDLFETRNEFHGGELGMSVESGWNRWTLDFLMRLAIGQTRQEVGISGQTTISPLVAPAETFTGGLLAQRSNIGYYSQSDFTMAPELNANLGFYLTPRLRFMVGYTLIYWGHVVRPGDQIDLDVNPDFIPEENDPFVGPLRPEFVFNPTDFWAHGINVGGDLRW